MVHTIKNYKKLLIFMLIAGLAGCDPSTQLKPLSQNGTILAFGDSLTFGTGSGSSRRSNKKLAYPAQLALLVSRKVINAGVPGEISKTGLSRLNALLKRHRPELLILCHGGNDILRHYNLKQTKDNIQQMINLAKANNTQVLLIGVPNFGLFLSPAAFYQELADSNQLPIENTALSEILRNTNLKSDQIHPNSKGYELFAQRIYTRLKQAGAV